MLPAVGHDAGTTDPRGANSHSASRMHGSAGGCLVSPSTARIAAYSGDRSSPSTNAQTIARCSAGSRSFRLTARSPTCQRSASRSRSVPPPAPPAPATPRTIQLLRHPTCHPRPRHQRAEPATARRVDPSPTRIDQFIHQALSPPRRRRAIRAAHPPRAEARCSVPSGCARSPSPARWWRSPVAAPRPVPAAAPGAARAPPGRRR